MTNLEAYRTPEGLVVWTFNPPEGSKLIASCPYWEGIKAAVRLLSMNEEFDGRFNLNGKLIPLEMADDILNIGAKK